ncbi:MAG: PKD domain-containing protein [Bacteroidota bacterium]|jgi:hypothetical protein
MKTRLLTACIMLSIMITGTSSFSQIVTNESFDVTPFPSGGWTNSGTGSLWVQRTNGTNPTCTPHSGAAMARFSSNQQPSGTQDFFYSPVIDYSFTQGATPYFSFWVYRESSSTAGDSITIFVNNTPSVTGAVRIGGVARSRFFTLPNPEPANGWYQYSFNIPASFNTNTNYIILRGTARGGGNIYVDDFSYSSYPTPCSGTPTPGTASSSVGNICGGVGSTNLSLSGASSGLGISYQWQSAPSDLGPWTDFGLNEDNINSGTITSTTWFRCLVSCSFSLQADSTSPVEVTVSSSPAPIVSVSPNTNVFYCTNSAPVLLVASGASSYSWSPNIASSTIGDSALAAPTQNTVYTIIGLDASGCADTTTLNVQVRISPNVNAVTNNDSICFGSTTNLQAFIQGGGFGIQYQWLPGPLSGNNQTVSPTNTTTYVVTATSQQTTCSNRDSVTIYVEPLIVSGFTFNVNGTIATFTNTSSGGTNYFWDFGDGSFSTDSDPFHAYAFDGTYTVTLIVGNAFCPNDTISQTVTIFTTSIEENKSASLLISPNPVNDILRINWELGAIQLLEIFDARGSLVLSKDCEYAKSLELNLSAWPSGVYNAIASGKSGRWVRRFTKN